MDISKMGVGAILGLLSDGGETSKTLKSCIGKRISSVALDDNVLRFKFSDGSQLSLRDDGQSCCESRYMTTADKLEQFSGADLVGFELKDAPDESCQYGSHEIQFLDVKTSLGVFQVANHNEHNGYYGGFCVKAFYTKGTQ